MKRCHKINFLTSNALLVTRHASRITRYSLLVTALLLAAVLAGCGGDAPGAPGSSGGGDTGVMLEATIVPTYNSANTYSVDVVQQICDAGPPPVYEIFTDHSATVSINARLLNPNTSFTPGTLYIERYTVEFRRSNDSVGAPPILTDSRSVLWVITPPSGTATSTFEYSAILVDLIRKIQYNTDILSGVYTSRYLNNYTAIYTFYGKNQYGDDFSFKSQVDFQIGSFNYCG